MTLVSLSILQKQGINSNTAKSFIQDKLGAEKQQANVPEMDRSRKNAVRGLMAPKGYTDDTDIFFFQFNPEQITDSKGNDWFSSKYIGFGSTQLFWVGGQERTISFDLFLDATAESVNRAQGFEQYSGYDAVKNYKTVFPNGVMDMIEKLQTFQYPISSEKPRFVGNVATPSPRFEAPPIVVFSFGHFYMECGLTGLDISYDLFDEDLIPRRALANVTLTVYDFDRIVKNSNLPKQINWHNDKS